MHDEYKGMYYDDSSTSKRFYEGGAHFKYNDLYTTLIQLKKKQQSSTPRHSSFPHKPPIKIKNNIHFPSFTKQNAVQSSFIHKFNSKSKPKPKTDGISINTGNITTRAVTTIAVVHEGMKKQHKNISKHLKHKSLIIDKKINNNNILFYGRNNSVDKNNTLIDKAKRITNVNNVNVNKTFVKRKSKSTSRSVSQNKHNSHCVNNYLQVKSRNNGQCKETISFKGNNLSVDNNNNNKYKKSKAMKVMSSNRNVYNGCCCCYNKNGNCKYYNNNNNHKYNRSISNNNNNNNSNKVVNINVLTIPINNNNNKNIPQSTVNKIKSNYTQLYLKKITKQKQKVIMTIDCKMPQSSNTNTITEHK